MLASREESLREIANGAGVGYHWLTKYWQGKFSEPGIFKIQRVHDYLLSRQREAA